MWVHSIHFLFSFSSSNVWSSFRVNAHNSSVKKNKQKNPPQIIKKSIYSKKNIKLSVILNHIWFIEELGPYLTLSEMSIWKYIFTIKQNTDYVIFIQIMCNTYQLQYLL